MKKLISILVAVVVSVASVFAFDPTYYGGSGDVNHYILWEDKSDEEAIAAFVADIESYGYLVAYRVVKVDTDAYETFYEAARDVFAEDIADLHMRLYDREDCMGITSIPDATSYSEDDVLVEIGCSYNGYLYMIVAYPEADLLSFKPFQNSPAMKTIETLTLNTIENFSTNGLYNRIVPVADNLYHVRNWDGSRNYIYLF